MKHEFVVSTVLVSTNWKILNLVTFTHWTSVQHRIADHFSPYNKLKVRAVTSIHLHNMVCQLEQVLSEDLQGESRASQTMTKISVKI
jgi:hypothetical protein